MKHFLCDLDSLCADSTLSTKEKTENTLINLFEHFNDDDTADTEKRSDYGRKERLDKEDKSALKNNTIKADEVQ